MYKLLKILLGIVLLTGGILLYYYSSALAAPEKLYKQPTEPTTAEQKKLATQGKLAMAYCKKHGLSTTICCLIDMDIPSGRNRFFVYNMATDSIICAGLVAHGSCNESFLSTPLFSNTSGSGCSALGKYKIGYAYTGRFGKAYKLYGLDSSNSNAFNRNIVLHSYYLVPDKELYPLPICNSLGCAMVSENYLNVLANTIKAAKKPLLLWMFQ